MTKVFNALLYSYKVHFIQIYFSDFLCISDMRNFPLLNYNYIYLLTAHWLEKLIIKALILGHLGGSIG